MSANLTGDLPPYQREGFYWGRGRMASAFGCDAPQQVARWPRRRCDGRRQDIGRKRQSIQPC